MQGPVVLFQPPDLPEEIRPGIVRFPPPERNTYPLVFLLAFPLAFALSSP